MNLVGHQVCRHPLRPAYPERIPDGISALMQGYMIIATCHPSILNNLPDRRRPFNGPEYHRGNKLGRNPEFKVDN